MAQKPKVNPHKIPKTQADVDKAYDLGVEAGGKMVLDLFVYTIGADMGMPDDWLDRFHERFMKNLECHVHGELTTYDMRKTLYAEKNWRVELK